MKTKLTDDVKKRISRENYYTVENFVCDAKAYVAAVSSGRINYTVIKVSRSGMSRTLRIQSYEGTRLKGYYRSYFLMLRCLGYTTTPNDDIRVAGCGMNMVFATNYDIIFSFYRMGFITKKSCDVLCQKVN